MTKEELREWVFKKSGKVAFYFASTKGIPVDLFKEEWKKMSLLEQYRLCLQYENN